MSRAKIFLRRRYSQLDGSNAPESVERSALASGSFSEIRSPFSIAGRGLGQQKDRLESPRSAAYTDYDKAESVTNSMAYKWFGGEVENTLQNSTMAGTNVANWLEKHTTTIQSVQESDSEPTLGGQISYQNRADSVASTQVNWFSSTSHHCVLGEEKVGQCADIRNNCCFADHINWQPRSIFGFWSWYSLQTCRK